MNEAFLVKFDKMSDEELELQSMSIIDIRLKRCDRKIKDLTRDVEIGKVEREKQEKQINKINKVLKTTCIDRFKYSELDKEMVNRVVHFVGKIGSCEYILFFSYYKRGIVTSVKKEFGVNEHKLASIKDLKESDFENTKKYIRQWKPNGTLTEKALKHWDKKDFDETITNTEKEALRKYYNKITLKEIKKYEI